MPQLHETVMGHRLIEGTIPRMVKALERIADALEKRTPATSVEDAQTNREIREEKALESTGGA